MIVIKILDKFYFNHLICHTLFILLIISSCSSPKPLKIDPEPKKVTKSSYSGEFGMDGMNYKIETNFELQNKQLLGTYIYVQNGTQKSGKLYDTITVNNKLELVWEERIGGEVYKGKLKIQSDNNWTNFHGTWINSRGRIGGNWKGKIKNGENSVIPYYFNIKK